MARKGTQRRGRGEVSRAMLEFLLAQERDGQSGVPAGVLLQKVADKLEPHPNKKTMRSCYQTLIRLVNDGLVQKNGRGGDATCTLTRSGREKVGVRETSTRLQHPKRVVAPIQASNPLLELLELLNERLPHAIEYVRRIDEVDRRLVALEAAVEKLSEPSQDGRGINQELLDAIRADLEAMRQGQLLEEEGGP